MKRLASIAALIWFGAMLSGCATIDTSEGLTPSGVATELAYVDILYGTDRTPGPQKGQFTDGRNGKLTLGSARVTIPPNRTPGIVQRPTVILFFRFKEDPLKHLALAGPPKVMTQAEFVASAASASPGALLYVHGYNTDFAGGLYRTAQLAHDLNFKGYAFHYSWPSRGSMIQYDYDSDSERQAELYFLEYLKILLREAKVRELTIIVHSKGNDMVLSALSTLQESAQPLDPGSLNQLVLASPDVEPNRARQLLAKLGGKFTRITLYANNRDIPLKASKKKAGGAPRAGQLARDGRPLIIEGVDSIDASAANWDWTGLNHNAYVFDDRLREDLRAVVKGEGPPEGRTNHMRKLGKPGAIFWRLQ